MAKFCGKCGAKLDEQTGLCPNCNADELKAQLEQQSIPSNEDDIIGKSPSPESPLNRRVEKREAKRVKEAQKTANIKAARKDKWAIMTIGQKIKFFLIKLSVLLLVLAILITGITGALVYYDFVDIPIIDDLLILTGLKEAAAVIPDASNSYEVTSVDAESYFEDNSNILTVINVNDSDSVPTEAEVCDNLCNRGFVEYPIITEYSMEGEYYTATNISDSSSTKHPIYQTNYITTSGDIWTIFVINGAVMANPVSFNIESGLDVQMLISESFSVTSYDSASNKFYETIPNASEVIVKTVGRIDIETLDKLTIEAIGEL